jgi:hypothetical protein
VKNVGEKKMSKSSISKTVLQPGRTYKVTGLIRKHGEEGWTQFSEVVHTKDEEKIWGTIPIDEIVAAQPMTSISKEHKNKLFGNDWPRKCETVQQYGRELFCWQKIDRKDIKIGDTIRIVDCNDNNNIKVNLFEVIEFGIINNNWLRRKDGTWVQAGEDVYQKLCKIQDNAHKEENHEGMIQNPITGEWSWL